MSQNDPQEIRGDVARATSCVTGSVQKPRRLRMRPGILETCQLNTSVAEERATLSSAGPSTPRNQGTSLFSRVATDLSCPDEDAPVSCLEWRRLHQQKDEATKAHFRPLHFVSRQPEVVQHLQVVPLNLCLHSNNHHSESPETSTKPQKVPGTSFGIAATKSSGSSASQQHINDTCTNSQSGLPKPVPATRNPQPAHIWRRTPVPTSVRRQAAQQPSYSSPFQGVPSSVQTSTKDDATPSTSSSLRTASTSTSVNRYCSSSFHFKERPKAFFQLNGNKAKGYQILPLSTGFHPYTRSQPKFGQPAALGANCTTATTTTLSRGHLWLNSSQLYVKGLSFETTLGGYTDVLMSELEANYENHRSQVMTKNLELVTPVQVLTAIRIRAKIFFCQETRLLTSPTGQQQWRCELYFGMFCGVGHGLTYAMSHQLAAAHVLERMRIFIEDDPAWLSLKYGLYPGTRFRNVLPMLQEVCKNCNLGEVIYTRKDLSDQVGWRWKEKKPRWEASAAVSGKKVIVRSDDYSYGVSEASKTLYEILTEHRPDLVTPVMDYVAVGSECPKLKDIHPQIKLEKPSAAKAEWMTIHNIPDTDIVLHDPSDRSSYIRTNLVSSCNQGGEKYRKEFDNFNLVVAEALKASEGERLYKMLEEGSNIFLRPSPLDSRPKKKATEVEGAGIACDGLDYFH